MSPGNRKDAKDATINARVSRFLRVVLAVTTLAHLPIALGVAEIARRLGWAHPGLAGTAWAAAGVLLFAGRARAGMPDRKKHAAVARFVDVPYFVHWCAAVFALVPSAVATVVGPLIDLLRGSPVGLPIAFYMWAYIVGLVVCGYGIVVRRRSYRVVERTVWVRGLPASFSGFRIAHLSDLHIGTLTPKAWGLRWARSANAARVDLAVVTGDMVTSGTAYHDDIAEVVGALRARRGTVVALGNHDYFGDAEALVSRLEARGVTVLRNEGFALAGDADGSVWVAAIDDTWTRRDDLTAALRGRPPNSAVILLAHDPERFDRAADAGADLVLSGHTHGGQVAMPFFSRRASLATIAHTYSLGFYERGTSVLYVHPGLGTTGPPIRLGVAPEVTILILWPMTEGVGYSASSTHSSRARATSLG